MQYYIMEFLYCSGYNTLQNFGLHPIFYPPLRVLLDFYTHSGLSCELVWVFAPTLLDRSTNIFFMLVTMSHLWPCSGRTQGLHFVCTCCVFYVNICRPHTRSHIHCRAGIVMVIQQSITSIVLVNLHHWSIMSAQPSCSLDCSSQKLHRFVL